MKAWRFFGAVAAALGLASGAASAADYAGRNIHVVTAPRHAPPIYRGYTGLLPACEDPQVQGTIARGFRSRERTYWSSSLELTTFTRPMELGYRSWGAEFIPRRFCSARTVTTDGRRREVYFVIAENQAPGSFTWGVDWCVTGLDRSYHYAPDCKMARP